MSACVPRPAARRNGAAPAACAPPHWSDWCAQNKLSSARGLPHSARRRSSPIAPIVRRDDQRRQVPYRGRGEASPANDPHPGRASERGIISSAFCAPHRAPRVAGIRNRTHPRVPKCRDWTGALCSSSGRNSSRRPDPSSGAGPHSRKINIVPPHPRRLRRAARSAGRAFSDQVTKLIPESADETRGPAPPTR